MAYLLLIMQAIAGEPIEIWEDPSKAHDIVCVKDLWQMIGKTISVDRCSGFYNVGTGRPVSLKDQIEGIIEVFSPKRNPSTIIPCPDRQMLDHIQWIFLMPMKNLVTRRSMITLAT